MTTTIMSRFARAKAKTLTLKELIEKKNYCARLALQWLSIPNGIQQANKYFDAEIYYTKLIEKKQ